MLCIIEGVNIYCGVIWVFGLLVVVVVFELCCM